ncbi:phosphoglycerate mutase-like protein [Lizonia empirigonia]|nr:phosphoglycerate mutase-like protein [Lizonia empirigonia]
MVPLIHIVRHGQSLHNVDHGYPHRDPPLTEAGQEATKQINVPAKPDLIIISPMTRTIQTAMNIFPDVFNTTPFPVEVQIWPDLRETYEAESNKGLSRKDISAKFPQLDFAECPEEWDHPPYTVAGAALRAERVRRRLRELSNTYSNIVLVTHRGFIAVLAQGNRFEVCETRSYRFGSVDQSARLRMGTYGETEEPLDFGPTVLVPVGPPKTSEGSFVT